MLNTCTHTHTRHNTPALARRVLAARGRSPASLVCRPSVVFVRAVIEGVEESVVRPRVLRDRIGIRGEHDATGGSGLHGEERGGRCASAEDEHRRAVARRPACSWPHAAAARVTYRGDAGHHGLAHPHVGHRLADALKHGGVCGEGGGTLHDWERQTRRAERVSRRRRTAHGTRHQGRATNASRAERTAKHAHRTHAPVTARLPPLTRASRVHASHRCRRNVGRRGLARRAGSGPTPASGTVSSGKRNTKGRGGGTKGWKWRRYHIRNINIIFSHHSHRLIFGARWTESTGGSRGG